MAIERKGEGKKNPWLASPRVFMFISSGYHVDSFFHQVSICFLFQLLKSSRFFAYTQVALGECTLHTLLFLSSYFFIIVWRWDGFWGGRLAFCLFSRLVIDASIWGELGFLCLYG